MPDVAQRTIRVAVAGGHPVILGVVRLACQEAPDLELVAELDRADGASAAILLAQPDIAVIDLDMANSLTIFREVRDKGFAGRVMVLSDRPDGRSVLEALRHGADGYLVKADGLREIASSIRRIAAGEQIIAAEHEDAAMRELGRFAVRARQGAEAASAITRRQHEVLSLLVEGLTMRQIGRRLAISPRTVEAHAAMLYRKLGVRTRVQVVSRAVALGLVDLH